jgi:hypothetical protein
MAASTWDISLRTFKARRVKRGKRGWPKPREGHVLISSPSKGEAIDLALSIRFRGR